MMTSAIYWCMGLSTIRSQRAPAKIVDINHLHTNRPKLGGEPTIEFVRCSVFEKVKV